MFERRLTTLSAIVFFFAIGTVVLADPPTVSIQQIAELLPAIDEGDPAVGIFVHVVVNCGDGETDGTIVVGARQGSLVPPQNIDTVENAETRQEVTVFIPGPFVPGDAQASAELGCGLLISGLDLGRTIRIVEP